MLGLAWAQFHRRKASTHYCLLWSPPIRLILVEDLILVGDPPAEDSAGTIEQSARVGAASSDQDGPPICGKKMMNEFSPIQRKWDIIYNSDKLLQRKLWRRLKRATLHFLELRRTEKEMVEFSLVFSLAFATRITCPKIDEIQAFSHLPGSNTNTSRAP